jgi:ABC-2 type transport system permease protein
MTTASLVKASIRGTTWFSTDGLKQLVRPGKVGIFIVASVGILVGVAAMELMLTGVYRSLLGAGLSMGRPELLIFYGLLMSWALQLVTAVPISLSLLYYSSDLRLLLTLPVRPVQIIAAKGLLLFLSSMPIHLAIFVPALWMYIGAAGLSTPVVISGLLSLFVTPLLPLSLCTLFVLGLMKAVNLSRYRIALEVAGMTLAIVLLVGMQLVLSRTAIGTATGNGSPEMLAGLTGVFAALERALPPIAWAARGFVVGAGPLPILLSLLVTAGLVALVALLAPLNFLSDVMERRESQKGRRHGAARAAGQIAPRGLIAGLMAREWAILSSNSTFIFEAAGEVIVLPLVLGIYSLVIPKAMLSQALATILSMPVLSIALMAIAVLMTSLTTVSATSISREGPRMALSLTLPIPGRVQVRAKLYIHLLLFSTAFLVDLAILQVLFHFPLVSLAYMIPAGISLHIVGFVVSISFDLKRPLLKWTHPQQAMKNNTNALSSIGITSAGIILLMAPAALWVFQGGNQMLAGCAVAVVSVVLAVLLLPRVYAFADRQYGGGLEMDA